MVFNCGFCVGVRKYVIRWHGFAASWLKRNTASELWEFEIVMLQFHHSPTSLSHQFIWLIVYYFDYLWFITSVFCIPTIHTSNPYMWSYRGLAAKQENRNVHAKTWTSFVCDCFFCFVCLFVCGKKAIYTQNGSSLFFLVANCEI